MYNLNKTGKIKKILAVLSAAVICCAAAIAGIDIYVIMSDRPLVLADYSSGTDTASQEEAADLKEIRPQCIMVLGASVHSDGTPSPMLKDRLDTAVDLYMKGVSDKLLLSGDNGQQQYNEVQGMKDYVMSCGVKEEDIFMDHAGFSTYESVHRAGSVFQVDRMIVVTQRYHLYRALYGCRRMGIKAAGAASDQYVYDGQLRREIREILARDKDFVKWIFRPDPTFLGDPVPVE